MAVAAPSIPSGLKAWAARHLGPIEVVSPLAGDGGGRRYFRLPGQGLLLLYGPDQAENLAWLRIGRHLWFGGLALPRILAHDLERGFFILEDLGDELLTGPGDNRRLYPLAAELLADLHNRGAGGFNPAWCHQSRRYSAAMAEKNEIGYFLKSLASDYLGFERPPAAVYKEASALARAAASAATPRVLMHRDFQGRNLIYRYGRVYALDWQGARYGPAAYDLMSLLEECPRHPLSEDFKAELTGIYLRRRGGGLSRRAFGREMVLVGACRLMQALGAYGKLSLAGKTKFAAFIPPALRGLNALFKNSLLAPYPGLKDIAARALAQSEMKR